jgi:hypothetical protein
MSSLVPRIAPRPPHPPRQVPTAETPQTHAILVCREAASIRPMDSGSRAEVAMARTRPPPELVRTARHGVVDWQCMPSTREQLPGRRLRSMASGRRQPNPERGIESDQTLNVEGGAGGECQVFNGLDKANRGDGRVD